MPLIESLADSRIGSNFIFLLIIALIATSFGIRFISHRSDVTVGVKIYGMDSKVFIAAMLLLIPFIPASNVFVTVGFAIAERVLYTPSMGFAIIIVEGMRRLGTTV